MHGTEIVYKTLEIVVLFSQVLHFVSIQVHFCFVFFLIPCQCLTKFYLKLTRAGLLLILQGEMDLNPSALDWCLDYLWFSSKKFVTGMQKHV